MDEQTGSRDIFDAPSWPTLSSLGRRMGRSETAPGPDWEWQSMPRVKRQPPVEAVDVSTLDSLSFQERLAIGLERLKAERKVTNRELAVQLGVHEAYISQVTRAMRDVKLSTLDKMQREWNVLIEDLLKITEDDLPRIAVWKARRKKQKTAGTDS
ncbi:helix-turn-helix domain-containing protein [Agrobacterium pusense]|uniref:helix-turn-helix domain-containing protein n=2 Tax=Rhizobium/Agrobacterium group TaxID=227290 RepID=UPI0038501EB5